MIKLKAGNWASASQRPLTLMLQLLILFFMGGVASEGSDKMMTAAGTHEQGYVIKIKSDVNLNFSPDVSDRPLKACGVSAKILDVAIDVSFTNTSPILYLDLEIKSINYPSKKFSKREYHADCHDYKAGAQYKTLATLDHSSISDASVLEPGQLISGYLYALPDPWIGIDELQTLNR